MAKDIPAFLMRTLFNGRSLLAFIHDVCAAACAWAALYWLRFNLELPEPFAADMGRSGAEIIDFDWMVDLRQASAAIDAIPCGNLDPVAVFYQGTPEQVGQGVRRNAAETGGRWISAAGCEIPDGTPQANLRAQAQALLSL